MDDFVPSYILKLNRAKTHLKALQESVEEYRTKNAYEIRRGVKKQSNLYWVEITERPPDSLRLIAADFFHNVHSGLDHLACALAPAKNRRSVMFPIFWPGVWETPQFCENRERLKDRERWTTITREMKPGAVTVLKSLQPIEDPWNKSGEVQVVEFVHRLWNRDKHMNLPILTPALVMQKISWELDGLELHDGGQVRDRWLEDRAPFGAPNGAVIVKFKGIPNIGIRPSEVQGDVPIVGFCEHVLDFIERGVYEPLYPFVHRQSPPTRGPRNSPWGPGATKRGP